MEENYILFETAKLAKEKGFNEPTFCGYKENYGKNYKGESINPYLIKYNLKLFNNKYNDFEAPTQSLLQKWLREKYSLHITIFSSSQESWMYRITKPHQQLNEGFYDEDYDTYEDALEAALIKALNLI